MFVMLLMPRCVYDFAGGLGWWQWDWKSIAAGRACLILIIYWVYILFDVVAVPFAWFWKDLELHTSILVINSSFMSDTIVEKIVGRRVIVNIRWAATTSRFSLVRSHTWDVVYQILSTQTLSTCNCTREKLMLASVTLLVIKTWDLSKPKNFDLEACSFVDCYPHCVYNRNVVKDFYTFKCWSVIWEYIEVCK